MLIILEGPPGVGKSSCAETLAAEIIRRYPRDTVEILRPGIPRVHPLDAYVMPLLDYRPRFRHDDDSELISQRRRHIICDGWHISEMVYADIFGRRTEMTRAVCSYIEMFLLSRGALVVYLRQDAEALVDVAAERGYGSPDSRTAAYRTMVRFQETEKSRPYSLKMICHVESPNLVADILGRSLVAEHARASMDDFTTYVGHRTPRLLVLGNARGSGIRHHDVPAFMPYPSTCGLFLMEALSEYTTLSFPKYTALANAMDVDCLADILSYTQPNVILALGTRAYEAAVQLNPHVWRIDHPAVARRAFRGSRGSRLWGEMLESTIGPVLRRYLT